MHSSFRKRGRDDASRAENERTSDIEVRHGKGKRSRFQDSRSSQPQVSNRPPSRNNSPSRRQTSRTTHAEPDDGSDREAFVWKKKTDLERKAGHVQTAESEALRMRQLRVELEEEQQQRTIRDAERAEREAGAAKIAREEEQDRNVDARREEASFAGKQHFARQAIRLRERRPVLADAFARVVRLDLRNVNVIDAARPDEKKPAPDDIIALIDAVPHDNISKMLDSVEDELDYIPDFPPDADDGIFNQPNRLDFWQCVRTVLTNRSNMGPKERRIDGVHSAVQPDVDAVLEAASVQRLVEMESEIIANLQPDGSADDQQIAESEAFYGEVDFWSAVVKLIRSSLTRQRLASLGRKFRIERLRRAALSRRKGTDGASGAQRRAEGNGEGNDERMVREEAAKGMGDDEEAFMDEVAAVNKPVRMDGDDAPTTPYLPNDKYRPRKPRYFNRVHTGYNWSKYNRTHYDHDNPPPKMVQGYKFNIFYPDLIKKSSTPTYEIKKTANADVSIITFKGGPPYEDVAFKIVNRPWESSHKRGYRCSFDRGVLHLWFYFQRYRYRR